jgi:PAS domain S-box-containing protein
VKSGISSRAADRRVAPWRPPPIAWHRRLQTHVALGVTVLVAFSLGAVLLITTRVITTRSLDLASAELDAARTAFYHLADHRAQSAADQARMITTLPVFRATMTDSRLANDTATIEAMAEEYRRVLKARFCIVTNPAGRWTGSPGWPTPQLAPPALMDSIAVAVNGEAHHDIVTIDNTLFLIVSGPAVFAEEILGTLTVGYALDDELAGELAEVTHSEVNLVAGSHLSGSSLPPSERELLAAELIGGRPASFQGDLSIERLGESEYVTGIYPLGRDVTAGSPGQLLLLKDWRPTQQFLAALRRQLFEGGVVIFFCALVGGALFSRRVSRPLADIAAAAAEMTAGQWERQVPVRGSAEATTMARAFNAMGTNLHHWYQEAQDNSARLLVSYDRFYAVTDSARDAIVSTDEQGAITFWNRSAGTIFGYGDDAALGMHLTQFMAEADVERYRDALATLRTGAEHTLGRTIEITAVGKDGQPFPAEFSLSAWPSGHGTALTAVVRDVTARKQAEALLHLRDEQLRQGQKMEAIGRLAGGVAHDFNNLLTVITGYGEQLIDRLEPDEDRHPAEQILKAAGRAASLTRQLLTFSRRQALAPQVLMLDQIVADAKKMLSRLIGEDINFETSIDAALGNVLADPGHMEQLLMNLTVNARDAMPDGGQLLVALRNITHNEADVAARPGLKTGRYVELSVTDTGCGMDAQTVSHIFEPFFTTKEKGKGTGLGLATVYAIVQQSGGVIEVESRVGEGTTFRVSLPQVAAVLAGIEAAAPSIEPSPGAQTVLLVEDEGSIRELVGSMLRDVGYTVIEAGDGEEALELARTYEGAIDLVLTDVVMPGIDGCVLAERLTAVRTSTRVLYMSGYACDLKPRLENDAAHFLQKPFSRLALVGKVCEVLTVDEGADIVRSAPAA